MKNELVHLQSTQWIFSLLLETLNVKWIVIGSNLFEKHFSYPS